MSAEIVVLKDSSVQIEGFRRAVKRLREAVAIDDDNGIYISVMQALNWLPVFVKGSDFNGNADVRALLYARHRGSHQQASVIERAEGDVWRWRPAVTLPMPPSDEPEHHHPKLRKLYERRLERQPVLEVFERLPSMLKP